MFCGLRWIGVESRYVDYFANYLRAFQEQSTSPLSWIGRLGAPAARPLRLLHVRMMPVPNFDIGGGCDPFFLCEGPCPRRETLFDYRKFVHGKVPAFGTKDASCDLSLEINDHTTKDMCVLSGDVKFIFYDEDTLRSEKMCWFWVNTAFIQDGYICLTKTQCDGAKKDKKGKQFAKEFKCELWFEDAQQ